MSKSREESTGVAFKIASGSITFHCCQYIALERMDNELWLLGIPVRIQMLFSYGNTKYTTYSFRVDSVEQYIHYDWYILFYQIAFHYNSSANSRDTAQMVQMKTLNRNEYLKVWHIRILMSRGFGTETQPVSFRLMDQRTRHTEIREIAHRILYFFSLSLSKNMTLGNLVF